MFHGLRHNFTVDVDTQDTITHNSTMNSVAS